eukprot:jgi/Botrbrau1/1989/Bobra.0052s0031.1
MKDEQADIIDIGAARRFLTAMSEFSDLQDLLFRLVDQKEHGIPRIKAMLSVGDTPEHVEDVICPFLHILSSDALARSMCISSVHMLLTAVYRTPGLVECLLKAVKSEYLPNSCLATISWFLVRIAKSERARDNDYVIQMAQIFRDRKVPGARELGNLILASVEGAGMETDADHEGLPGMSLQELQAATPGGRHDNDHRQYRDIRIIPTVDEVCCAERPYLPSLDEDCEISISNAEDRHLDYHFRLLREDLVAPLRETLKELATLAQSRKNVNDNHDGGQGQHDRKKANSPKNVFSPVYIRGIRVVPRPALMVGVDLPKSVRAARLDSKTDRVEYWTHYGRSILPMHALVCLVNVHTGQPLAFATIVRREVPELAGTDDWQQPMIGINIMESADEEAKFLKLLAGLPVPRSDGGSNDTAAGDTTPQPHDQDADGAARGERLYCQQVPDVALVQVSTSYFSYEPVLKALQSMPIVPLHEELVLRHPPRTIDNEVNLPELGWQQKIEALAINLDESQKAALLQALTQRVALIQGPPGTGKTFIGVQLCSLLTRFTQEKILCVCYTNHALDQFLEALLDEGVADVVRVGTRSKSQRLEQYNIANLAKENASSNNTPSRSAESRRKFNLEDERRSLESGISDIRQLLAETKAVQAACFFKTWREASPFFRDRYPGVLKQLMERVNGKDGVRIARGRGAKAMGPEDLWLSWVRGLSLDNWGVQGDSDKRGDTSGVGASEIDHEDFEMRGGPLVENSETDKESTMRMPEAEDTRMDTSVQIGQVGQQVRQVLLSLKEMRGSAGVYVRTGTVGTGTVPPKDMFELSKSEREQMLAVWQEEYHAWNKERVEDFSYELACLLRKLYEVNQERRKLEDLAKERVLANARVIGCTTTGAAMHKELLMSVTPSVGLVEEAGEILESHILTSFNGSSTKQLILIGDHKQLRPKCEVYDLTVQAGKGYHLNESLFERLVHEEYPHVVLEVQHRMRPEISALIRNTYPELKDHPRVLNRPNIKGLADNVIFISHTEGEGADSEVTWADDRNSKVNMHEVRMVASIVRYIYQQGYTPENMVVLTPYLGQLVALQRILAKDWNVMIDERDMWELRTAASSRTQGEAILSTEKAANDKGVRISTIDNYQGEEADIVIASLVRSNTDGRIGFLREPERVNVLLSRARDGLIMIGNGTTLTHARNDEGRKIWEQLLRMLSENGHIYDGLPVICQRHGRKSEVPLSKPPLFQKYVPDGGCREACGATLPCGHLCPLLCHAFDQDHKNVRCMELKYEYCSKGHLVVRRCSQESVACGTCAELEKIDQKRRRDLEALEQKQAEVRKQADLRRAEAEHQIQVMLKKQEALEEKRRLRAQELETEARRRKMEEMLRIEEKRLPKDLKAIERESQKRTDDEIDIMIQEAELAAHQTTHEAQTYEPGDIDMVDALEENVQSLEQAEVVKEQIQKNMEKDLQDLSNKIRKLESHAEDNAVDVVSKHERHKDKIITVLDWKRAASLTGAADGMGLQRFKEAVAAMPTEDVSALDLAFEEKGIGKELKSFATDSHGQGTIANPEQVFAPLKAGLKKVADGDWLSAYDIFEAQANRQTFAGPFLSLCLFNLGSHKEAEELVKAQDAKTNPVAHVVAALLEETRFATVAISGRRRSIARVCGHALGYLLHPWSDYLPDRLRQTAVDLLRQRAESMLATPLVGGQQSRQTKMQSKDRWNKQAESSAVLSKLFELVGLEEVKNAFCDLLDQVQLDQERKRSVHEQQYNTLFYGNPGTGKTTVARLYAEFLKEIGVLPGSAIKETTGAALVNGGLTDLKKLLTDLDKGGVLFIDEAYQLKPAVNPQGAQVLDYLLPELENKRGKLVVVLAGYEKDMQKLIEYNEGLPSRFPLVFNFSDYSDEELCYIWQRNIDGDKLRFKVEDEKYARIAMRRLGRMRGRAGFGNARAVRNFYELTLKRQSARIIKERKFGGDPDPLLLARDDLLGPKCIDESSSVALKKLSSMEGLAEVKKSVQNLLGLIRTNAELEEQEKPLKNITLNRVFLGNPGTGKTTVARRYGEILKDLGLLSKGEVIVKIPGDFIGSVLGESEKMTAAVIDSSLGCVLVIDEAYGLHSGKNAKDPYREAVIDTIVAKVQGVPGDDRCVLLLGYREQMQEMMRDANPGLSRRFQLEDAWEFEDFTDTQLFRILRAKAKAAYGWEIPPKTAREAVRLLAKERMKPNFGNAGAVDNLLARAAQQMEDRTSNIPPLERAALKTPEPEDFMSKVEAESPADPEAIFSDLIGCKSVLDILRGYKNTITLANKQGRDPRKQMELSFIFVGNPGTGKTTVARRMGQLFQSLNILPNGNLVVSCTASDFITGYANQAAGKTRDVFRRALGGVLFIDEAYRLNPKIGGPYMSEVLDEIVQILTEPQFHQKLVVIFAGYEAEIEAMLDVNPGLKSRVSQKLHFPDFSVDDACKLLRILLKDDDLSLSADAAKALESQMSILKAAPGWANGRDVVTWEKRIYRAVAERLQSAAQQNPPDDTDDVFTEVVVEADDLQSSLTEFLASKGFKGERKPRLQPVELGNLPEMQQATATQTAPPARAPSTATATQLPASFAVDMETATADETEVDEKEVKKTLPDVPSFGGLPNDFLEALTTAIQRLGHDTSSFGAMAKLAQDPGFNLDVLDSLGGLVSGYEAEILKEMVRQWQEAYKKAVEEQKALAKKKLCPVWRCAVCGRYGCQVAPYIESYVEMP